MNRNMHRPAIALSALLCITLLLVGCQRERPPVAESNAWPDSPIGITATPGTGQPAPTPQPGQTVVSVEGGPTTTAGSTVVQPGPVSTPPPVAETSTPGVVIPVGPIFEYIVQPGDTLFSLAQIYGTDVEMLRRLNNLPDDTIQVGQVLQIPGTGAAVEEPAGPAASAVTPEPAEPVEAPAQVIYIVERGDTLSSIATQFGVDWQAIAAANGIAGPNYTIYRGQQLVIPGVTPTPEPTAEVTTHTIQAGETLYSIAVRYGVTLEDLMQANDISNADLIYQGQVLIIPD